MTKRGKRSAVQDRRQENTDFVCVFRCASPITLCASRSCLPTQLRTRYVLLDGTYMQTRRQECIAVQCAGHIDDKAQIRTVVREHHRLSSCNFHPSALTSQPSKNFHYFNMMRNYL